MGVILPEFGFVFRNNQFFGGEGMKGREEVKWIWIGSDGEVTGREVEPSGIQLIIF